MLGGKEWLDLFVHGFLEMVEAPLILDGKGGKPPKMPMALAWGYCMRVDIGQIGVLLGLLLGLFVDSADSFH